MRKLAKISIRFTGNIKDQFIDIVEPFFIVLRSVVLFLRYFIDLCQIIIYIIIRFIIIFGIIIDLLCIQIQEIIGILIFNKVQKSFMDTV